MSSLQSALPNPLLPANLLGGLPQTWFSPNSVAAFVPPVSQGRHSVNSWRSLYHFVKSACFFHFRKPSVQCRTSAKLSVAVGCGEFLCHAFVHSLCVLNVVGFTRDVTSQGPVASIGGNPFA